MCYEYSFRKKISEEADMRRQQASFWTRVNAWVRDAKSALQVGAPRSRARQRRGEKVTG